MPVPRSRVAALLVLALSLAGLRGGHLRRRRSRPPPPGAAVTPGEAAGRPLQMAPRRSCTLNLPEHGRSAIVAEAPAADYTFLEKGYRALLDGEYDEAMQHFQRYQRLESSPRADLEAGIAIAYVRMLPRSAFYDPVAARKDFTRAAGTECQGTQGSRLHAADATVAAEPA